MTRTRRAWLERKDQVGSRVRRDEPRLRVEDIVSRDKVVGLVCPGRCEGEEPVRRVGIPALVRSAGAIARQPLAVGQVAFEIGDWRAGGFSPIDRWGEFDDEVGRQRIAKRA